MKDFVRRPAGSRRGPVLMLFVAVAGCGGENAEAGPESYAGTPADYTQREVGADSTALRFSDITVDAGLDFVHVNGAFGEKWMPETVGSGGGFVDYDGDGLPDIFLVNSAEWPGRETGPRPHSRLYRNRGDGTFEDVSASTGIARLTRGVYGMGVVFADYDADGDPDAYLTAWGDNLLLRNEGGVFEVVPGAAGATGRAPDPDAPPAWSTAAAWVDTDRDGWLDLFVCNYVQWTPETDLFHTRDGTTKSYATPEPYAGETCRLYRSVEGTRFVDVTEAAGVRNDEGKSLGVVAGDFDRDGWPDLFVANDMQPNFLYLNRGDGTFRDVATEVGVAFDEFGRARAGMGVDAVDLSGTGEASIAIGNFSSEALALFTPVGGGIYQDLAGSARLSRPTLLPLTFGVVFSDVDLDGHADLLISNGHIEPEIERISDDVTFEQPPRLFLNTGEGAFRDVTEALGEGFARPAVGRGLAVADIDGDLDPDILLTANAGPARLLRNDTPPELRGGALEVLLDGRAPNRDAIGAEIRVYAGGRASLRSVRAGSSYLSQSVRNPALFGLGEATAADSVEVTWPDGTRTLRAGPFPAGTTLRLVQGVDASDAPASAELRDPSPTG